MGYKDAQKHISEYFADKDRKQLEKELFYTNPELFNEIAKYRNYGLPKRYRNAAKKFPINNDLFFFESNLAKQYTGNPRYIYERMLELYPNLTYVWAYHGDKSIIPGNPIVVERKSDDYYKYLAQARIIINNTTFPNWYHRPETFYLQTWHGTPYKRMHWDRHNPRNPIKKSSPHFYAKSTGWDVLLSPNHYSTEKFRSCFKYEGKIFESGYPANDIFYNKEKYESKRNLIREKLGISDDALVYLYAPTWRDGGHLGHSMFKFDLLFDPVKFLDSAPENSILLIRSHHMSEATKELSVLKGRAIDVSDWDDAVELMCASDILITDYSSIVFDWYCSKKPVIYYVPDLEEYENKTRGVYFDINEVNCGVICKSEDELYDNLDVRDAPFYAEFYDEFCSLHNGNSADEVIKYVIDKNRVSSMDKLKNFIKRSGKRMFK